MVDRWPEFHTNTLTSTTSWCSWRFNLPESHLSSPSPLFSPPLVCRWKRGGSLFSTYFPSSFSSFHLISPLFSFQPSFSHTILFPFHLFLCLVLISRIPVCLVFIFCSYLSLLSTFPSLHFHLFLASFFASSSVSSSYFLSCLFSCVRFIRISVHMFLFLHILLLVLSFSPLSFIPPSPLFTSGRCSHAAAVRLASTGASSSPLGLCVPRPHPHAPALPGRNRAHPLLLRAHHWWVRKLSNHSNSKFLISNIRTCILRSRDRSAEPLLHCLMNSLIKQFH